MNTMTSTRRPLPRLLGNALALLSLTVLASAVMAERLPIGTSACSTEDFGATAPSGITWREELGLLAVTDPEANAIFLVDAACELADTIALEALGIVLPAGITWDGAQQRYAIVDAFTLQLVYISGEGVDLGRCRLDTVGVNAPFGITVEGAGNGLAIVDALSNQLVLVAGDVLDGNACDVTQRLDLPAPGGEAASPGGITRRDDGPGFSVVDFDSREVILIDGAAEEGARFRVSDALDSRLLTGVTYAAQRERYYLVDADEDMLYELDARGTSTRRCLADAVPEVTRIGFTYNEATHEFVIVTSDDGSAAVWYLDADTCSLNAQVSLDALGVAFPTGAEYLAESDELVISDESSLYFLDYHATQIKRSCNVPGPGARRIGDLSWFAPTNQLVLGTRVLDGEVLFTDLDCNLLAQNAVLAFQADFDDVTRQERSGNVVGAELQQERVFVTDLEGRALLDLSTGDLTLDAPFGIVAGASADRLIVAGLRDQGIYDWQVPLLLTLDDTLSGNFVGPGRAAYLDDRGEGYLSATIQFAAGRLPATGFYDAGRRHIVLSVELPTGTVINVEGVVGDDEIVFDPPLGRLSRAP